MGLLGDTYEEVGPINEVEIPDGPPPPAALPNKLKPLSEQGLTNLNPFFAAPAQQNKADESSSQPQYPPEVSSRGIGEDGADSKFTPLRDDGVNLDSRSLKPGQVSKNTPEKAKKSEESNESEKGSGKSTNPKSPAPSSSPIPNNNETKTKKNKTLWVIILLASSMVVALSSLIFLICLIHLAGAGFIPTLKR